MTTVETGVRARTRRAIIDAAIGALTRDPSVSLADIAATANVGRTTVHRYFPERSDLIDAVSADALRKISQAVVKARIDEGPVPAALARLCHELFEFGDVLMLLFTMPDLMARPEWQEETEDDRVLLQVIERGREEGTIDPELPATWVQQLLWSLLYTSWEQIRDYGMPKHDALTLCLHTFRKATAP